MSVRAESRAHIMAPRTLVLSQGAGGYEAQIYKNTGSSIKNVEDDRKGRDKSNDTGFPIRVGNDRKNVVVPSG